MDGGGRIQEEFSTPPDQTRSKHKQEELTSTRTHGGVLDFEESLGVGGHVGGGLREVTGRQKRRGSRIEDGRGRGREAERWGVRGGY